MIEIEQQLKKAKKHTESRKSNTLSDKFCFIYIVHISICGIAIVILITIILVNYFMLMVNYELRKNFVLDFLSASPPSKGHTGEPWLSSMSAPVKIWSWRVCFEIGCGQDIKDKHFGCDVSWYDVWLESFSDDVWLRKQLVNRIIKRISIIRVSWSC